MYIQYGIQVVTRQFTQSSAASGFLGIMCVTRQLRGLSPLTGPSRLAIVTLVLPHYANALARSGLIHKQFRRFCSDYGMPITIIAATGLAYWGRFDASACFIYSQYPVWLISLAHRYALEPDMTLPTTLQNFVPANGRSWVVKFWHLEAKYVGIAFPFGFVLFILFYFDANVSVS